jgi:hypothetical protein
MELRELLLIQACANENGGLGRLPASKADHSHAVSLSMHGERCRLLLRHRSVHGEA